MMAVNMNGSAAEGQWENGEGLWVKRLAIRWNGSSDAERGNPQSRAYATWFIVPTELEDAVRKVIASFANLERGRGQLKPTDSYVVFLQQSGRYP